MTATERLRDMLNELGVEYKDRDMCGKHVFHWGEPLHGAMFTDGGEWTELVVENASPEQAIAATLGAGTCKDVCSGTSEFTCSACGFNCDLTSWISLFDGDDGRHRHHHHGTSHYCPNCGRRVVTP